MEKYYENQQQRLLKICNRKRVKMTTSNLDEVKHQIANDTNAIIDEANLLLSQANTAGGWNILRHEIANFLYRAE